MQKVIKRLKEMIDNEQVVIYNDITDSENIDDLSIIEFESDEIEKEFKFYIKKLLTD